MFHPVSGTSSGDKIIKIVQIRPVFRDSFKDLSFRGYVGVFVIQL